MTTTATNHSLHHLHSSVWKKIVPAIVILITTTTPRFVKAGCSGYAGLCGARGSSAACHRLDGCYWSYFYETCRGTAKRCSSYYSESSCKRGVYSYCTWTDDRSSSGSSSSGGTYDDEDDNSPNAGLIAGIVVLVVFFMIAVAFAQHSQEQAQKKKKKNDNRQQQNNNTTTTTTTTAATEQPTNATTTAATSTTVAAVVVAVVDDSHDVEASSSPSAKSSAAFINNSTNSNLTQVTLKLPAGAMGLTLSNNLGRHCGGPVVEAIKETSPLKEHILVGDELVSIHGHDLTAATTTAVSGDGSWSPEDVIQTLRRYNNVDQRELTLVRETEQDKDNNMEEHKYDNVMDV